MGFASDVVCVCVCLSVLRQMLSVLTKLESNMPVAHMQYNRNTKNMFLIPSIPDLPDRYCLVLAPIMKKGNTLMKCLDVRSLLTRLLAPPTPRWDPPPSRMARITVRDRRGGDPTAAG